MEFKKENIYTALNAGELKVGDKVYLGDSIVELRYKFENYDYSPSELCHISDEGDWEFNFATKDTAGTLAYLVERKKEKKWRPYKDCDEMIADYKKRFNVYCSEHELPLIWVEHKISRTKRLITSFCTSAIGISDDVILLSKLLDRYDYCDGSPCGIKE